MSHKPISARDLRVILGAHNLDDTVESGRISHRVREFKQHSTWNAAAALYGDLTGDIAILQLLGEVQDSISISPICLPNEGILDIETGEPVGWGIYDESEKTSPLPRVIKNVNIYSSFNCSKQDATLAGFAWEKSFCAGRTGTQGKEQLILKHCH